MAGWHPDPDGDGINRDSDLCPNVYDPQQGDSDGDGIGDYCDSDYARPVLNGAITDLRAEHVTPYGAWLTLTSPYDDYWGWYSSVAWSTDPNELRTPEGFEAANRRGDILKLAKIHAKYGEKVQKSIVLNRLEPNTTYYVAMTRGTDSFDTRISNILRFRTPSISLPRPLASHPRVYATSAFIRELQDRKANNDSGWNKWESRIRARAQSSDYRSYCFDSALLYKVTGNQQDLSKALALLNDSIEYWETTALRGSNQYRWENAQLAACLDLLWNDVDLATRNRAVNAFLTQDEYHISQQPPTQPLHMGDTDHMASITRNWIVHGLTACDAADIDPALSARACEVLKTGHRFWHGVQLVKARRDKGILAQSGGYKPDGTSYGQGTQQYWLETFLALANAGESSASYAQYIENSLLSVFIHQLTPTEKGYATIGSVENYDVNYGIEKDSYQLRVANGAVISLFSGVLAKAGNTQAAGWAKFLANKVFDVDPLNVVVGTTVYRLMFESDSVASVDYRDTLDTFFRATGFGVVFDRTSWAKNASYLMFQAGWNYVDHIHADKGHFQLFRRGQWLTHESIAYGGTASCLGHNIWVMKTGDNGNGACPDSWGQNYFALSDNEKSRIYKASSGSAHTYVLAELAGAYNSSRNASDTSPAVKNFKNLQRSFLWLKDTGESGVDTLVLLDRIQTNTGAPSDAIGYFQLHMDVAPTIDGTSAEAILGNQKLVTDVISPGDVSLSVINPTGPAGGSDTQIYTYRLAIDPAVGSGSLNMMTVIRGADVGAVLSKPVPVHTNTLQGVFVEGALVLMPTALVSETGAAISAATVRVSTAQPLKLFITGLQPGASYALQATQSGADLEISLSPEGSYKADEGGVLGVYIDGNRKILPVDIPSVIFVDNFED